MDETVKDAWLAGLLEGEGCFLITPKRSKEGYVYPSYRVACNLCDEDVLRRVAEWAGVGYFRGPFIPKNPAHSPVWRWHVDKKLHVRAICERVLPYMGARRTAKILKILSSIEQYGQPAWKHGTRQGYEFHKCKCELCRANNTKRHRLRRERLAIERAALALPSPSGL